MSIRILSASELFPSSSDREGGFRGMDARFIALPVRQRSRREGQSKSPCPGLPRSGLLIDLPSLRPFSHALQAEALVLPLEIETTSIVTQLQASFAAVEHEQQLELVGPRVTE